MCILKFHEYNIKIDCLNCWLMDNYANQGFSKNLAGMSKSSNDYFNFTSTKPAIKPLDQVKLSYIFGRALFFNIKKLHRFIKVTLYLLML